MKSVVGYARKNGEFVVREEVNQDAWISSTATIDLQEME